jgi:DNA-binding PadR family transcriptional regulator
LKSKADASLPGEIRTFLPLTPSVFYTLFALANGDKHGYAIMKTANDLSDGSVRMGPGTLYTTIQRLLSLDLIEEITAEKPPEQLERRRRFYRLTRLGRRVFEEEIRRMTAALHQVRLKDLEPARGSDR